MGKYINTSTSERVDAAFENEELWKQIKSSENSSTSEEKICRPNCLFFEARKARYRHKRSSNEGTCLKGGEKRKVFTGSSICKERNY